MSESVTSKLTDVLLWLNPHLRRHGAYARATRILRYSGHYKTAWYAGRLFTSALFGAKRAVPTLEEVRLRSLLDRALAYERTAFERDTDVNGGDLVEFFAEWRRDVKAALKARSHP